MKPLEFPSLGDAPGFAVLGTRLVIALAMTLTSLLRKVGYVLAGASLTYTVMRRPPNEANATNASVQNASAESASWQETSTQSAPTSALSSAAPQSDRAQKSIDAARLSSVFDSTDAMRTRCTEARRGQGVSVVGASWRVVSQSFVNDTLSEQGDLMRTARIVPVVQNGATTGVQLFGVRGNTRLGELGFQNGDELREINGHDLTTPDHALEAYAHVRGEDVISIGIVRHGAPLHLYYVIC